MQNRFFSPFYIFCYIKYLAPTPLAIHICNMAAVTIVWQAVCIESYGNLTYLCVNFCAARGASSEVMKY